MHQDHPLADTLETLKSVVSQEDISHETHSLLALLQTQLPSLLRTHSQVQAQLAQKNSEIKRLNRSLRKTNSKLDSKTGECQELSNELQRVTRMYTQKVDKLLKYQENQLTGTEKVPMSIGKDKSRTQKSVGTDCQLLNQTPIKELSAQNALLKTKLQQTQMMLLEEQKRSRALSFRLQEIEEYSSEEGEEIKDNSTIDADSLRGDPFQDMDWEDETFEKEEEPEQTGWWHKIKKTSWHMYQSIKRKM